MRIIPIKRLGTWAFSFQTKGESIWGKSEDNRVSQRCVGCPAYLSPKINTAETKHYAQSHSTIIYCRYCRDSRWAAFTMRSMAG